MKAAIAWLLLVAVAYAHESATLLVTSSGQYSLVTDGVASPWMDSVDWAALHGQTITVQYLNGDAPPPSDTIAETIDVWCDEIDDPETRKAIADIWKQVINEVESGDVSLEESPHVITQRQKELDVSAEWRVFFERLAEMLNRQINEGKFSVDTLKSVHKGLVQ